MKRFKVIEKPLFLKSGVIGLTKEQTKGREHCLRPTAKKGEFEIIAEVCFKAGEIVGMVGFIIKSIIKMGKIRAVFQGDDTKNSNNG